MQLTVVRHGESESNIAGRWQGHGDSPLSERGVRQAAAVAQRLAGRSFDRVVSSDLSRASDTARAIAGRVAEDPIWREIDLGTWEGLTREQVAERFPEEVAALHRGEDVPVGGGESWGDVAARVRGAFEQLRAESEGQRVLLVAHGGVVISLVSSLFGVDALRPRPLGKISNTAITELDCRDGARLDVFADADHVGGAAVWRRELAAGHTVVDLLPGGPARPWDEVRATVDAWAREASGQHHVLSVDAASIASAARAVVGEADIGRFAAPRADGRCQLLARPGRVAVGGWNLAPLA